MNKIINLTALERAIDNGATFYITTSESKQIKDGIIKITIVSLLSKKLIDIMNMITNRELYYQDEY